LLEVGKSTTSQIESVIDASLIITVKKMSGSAIAVTEKRALTALHGMIEVKTKVTLRTRKGIHLKGVIEFVKFSVDEVDIAVILLDDGHDFEKFISCFAPPVYLTQLVTVVGLKYSGKSDEVLPYAQSTSVIMVEGGDSTLFQAQYYNFEGCSGTGIVTTLVGGEVVLIGVHVASHDNTLVPEADESRKRVRSMSDLEASISSAIHGHTAYSLVCEIARVSELVELLKEKS
jgi:hypothetical protein